MLIIKSATLRVEDFTENRSLFITPPPVIQVNKFNNVCSPAGICRWSLDSIL